MSDPATIAPRTVFAVALTALLLAGACAAGCARPATVPDATPTGAASPATAPAPVATGTAGPAPATAWPKVAFTTIAGGFERPVYVTPAGDGSGRLFVVEQRGTIRVVKGGTVLPTPYLDISSMVSGGNEQGLLGLAFAPSFESNGRFYIYYTDLNDDIVVARYSADPKADVATAGSGRRVLLIRHPYTNHNGGCLQFGPDGMLHLGTGDGGSRGDPENRAQNRASLLGKMLRLDVEKGATTPEIRQVGLRNPWRFSFDRATGELYIGDVGQNAWEEIDVLPKGGSGQNLGWNLWEGDHPYPEGTKRSRAGFTFPVAEYPRAEGQAVIGGYVYRGARIPGWTGYYFYADEVTGRLWAMRRDAGVWRTRLLAMTNRAISSFGEDEEGELYATELRDGTLYRMDAAP